MRYDPKQDVELVTIAELEAGDGHIVVSIQSYAGGEEKVGMVRRFLKGDGSVGFGRIGRLTYNELIEIIPALIKAREWLDMNEAKNR